MSLTASLLLPHLLPTPHKVRTNTPTPGGALSDQPPAHRTGEPRPDVLVVAAVHTLHTEGTKVSDG